MRMAGRLVLPPHDAEGHDHLPLLCQHPGDNGVHGPLLRCNAVGMMGIKGKGHAAVLEQNT